MDANIVVSLIVNPKELVQRASSVHFWKVPYFGLWNFKIVCFQLYFSVYFYANRSGELGVWVGVGVPCDTAFWNRDEFWHTCVHLFMWTCVDNLIPGHPWQWTWIGKTTRHAHHHCSARNNAVECNLQLFYTGTQQCIAAVNICNDLDLERPRIWSLSLGM